MPSIKRVVLLAVAAVLLSVPTLRSQLSIFPTLSGSELLDSLVEVYKPALGLNYGNARDTLYGKIMNTQDSLRGLYTGFQIFLDPAQDPTMAAFDAGLNTEHLYPRSKGAEENMARSDMHNLFPSRVNVNADRADLPFGEIPDQQTVSWYFRDRKQSSIPVDHIDAYSELGNDRFEPRESVKGDVARAMFYFYTMYRTEAELADRDYLPDQKNTLCDWHRQDPVDEQEWNRNGRIAIYQDNQPNPYILDCTLAFRAFCPERTLPACGFTKVQELDRKAPFRLQEGSPNPFSSQLDLAYELDQRGQVKIELLDALGRPAVTLVKAFQTAGQYRSSLKTRWLPAGVYCLQFSIQTVNGSWIQTQKLVKF